MRYILLICIMCNSFCTVFSQTSNTKFNVCGSPEIKFFYAAGGVFFSPASSKDNIADSALKYCNEGLKRVYNLNGIELSEAMFTSLNIKKKYVVGRKGKYTFQYSKDGCIEFAQMSLDVNLPIVLNGTKMTIENHKAILKKVKSKEVLFIKRTRPFFGGGRIYIETER